MKKFISLALSFLIVWALVAGGCYLLGINDYVVIGFAGALGGTFGPIIAAYISKKLKK